MTDAPGLDPQRVAAVLDRERTAWLDARPKTRAWHARSGRSQLHGDPHPWVHGFPPPVPLVVERAEEARLYDIDGHGYADFGLGATAALWGHTHPALVAALRDQVGRGLVTTWPHDDHLWVAEELARRFGLPFWQFTVSATDANRFALRIARAVTGRRRILVFNRAYHGAVDETNAALGPDGVESTTGLVADGVDVRESTHVVEFNDIDAVERVLAGGDVAAVVAEPAMTNGGAVVWPEPGFHDALRAATRRAGTLLVLDETQTIPAGPGGCTRLFGLQPDVFTIGKCIAGGVPAGAYGMTEQVAAAAEKFTEHGDGGLGSTLAGGALAVRAMRCVLAEVMTDEAYQRMHQLAERYAHGVQMVVDEHGLPWHVARLGARVSYAFTPHPPRNAGQLYPRVGGKLREALWLYLANRGVVVNGMSGAALCSPLTTEADVDTHGRLFAEVVGELAR